MNQIVEVKFKKDRQKSPVPTYSTFKSQDIETVEFHLEFDGFVLDENYTVEVFCKFKLSDTSLLEAAEISEGKAIFKFDSRYITRAEQVYCSVYVRQNDKSIDVRTFVFDVELSERDKGAKRTAEVYDGNYNVLLERFVLKLEEYRDSLPNASDVRADVDEVLNKFKTDSANKLAEYDTQVHAQLTSNQEAFTGAEIVRQNAYEQAESLRDSLTTQAVEVFEQSAESALNIKLGDIQADADVALSATVDAFNLRADGAVSDKLDEFDTTSGQILDDIQQAEAERVEAEKLREIRLAQLEAQLEIISKIILRQTIAMGASWDKSSNSRMTRMDVM